MAPKKSAAREAASSTAQTNVAAHTTATTSSAPLAAAIPTSKPSTATPSAVSTTGNLSWDKVLLNLYNHYINQTPQRIKLLDVFLAFLVAVGALQFVYCILVGNFPFNAFLSGFGATVGQFVLTISLRIQTTEANKTEFPKVSPERAFADYIVCSLILHFFCINLVN